MAAIGFALCLIPDKVWEPLPADVKTRLQDWLLGINDFDMPVNNWFFFRVSPFVSLTKIYVTVHDL